MRDRLETTPDIPSGRATYRRIVGVRMRRTQTELGALVIDADSGTPFHALTRKDRR